MKTRRDFLKESTISAGGVALFGSALMCAHGNKSQKSLVVSAATDDMLINQKYNPDNVVGIKINCLGAQLAFDNRIFFSQDPVAMDRVGLDILEKKRIEQGLEPIKDISTHIAACAKKKGQGTNDLSKIDLRELIV
jgi:hypothetical protein